MAKWTLIGLVLVFALGVSQQVGAYFYRMSYGKPRPRALLTVLPTDIRDWRSVPVALADSKAGVERVQGVLNYDEVYYREFSSSRNRFTVYVVFWGAGKMPPDLVATHIPQYCWAAAGWQCVKQDGPWRRELAGKPCWPAQERTFVSAAGHRQYVLVWHLVDGRPYAGRFSAGFRSDLAAYYRAPLKFIYGQVSEQLLIRISGDQPLAAVEKDPGVESLLSILAEIGLSPAATP